MKRRLSASDDANDLSIDVSPPSAFATGRPKRPRYDTLERTLAHMTLGSALVTASEDVDMLLRTSPSPHCVQDTLDVVLPSSVEEPDTPVDMEVEPTLVTDGTSSTAPPPNWESIETGGLDIKEVHISPAVLECLKRQTKCPPRLIPLPCQTSQALVLYRAVPQLLASPCEHHEEPSTRTSTLVTYSEDDVMEME